MPFENWQELTDYPQSVGQQDMQSLQDQPMQWNYIPATDIETAFNLLGAFGSNFFISTMLGDIVNPVLTININTN